MTGPSQPPPSSHAPLRDLLLQGGFAVAPMPARVAFGAGALVVNSSQDGGGKDTWVLGR